MQTQTVFHINGSQDCALVVKSYSLESVSIRESFFFFFCCCCFVRLTIFRVIQLLAQRIYNNDDSLTTAMNSDKTIKNNFCDILHRLNGLEERERERDCFYN